MPDDLRSQFALVRDVLAVHRIPIVEIEGQEADDVIATLARQAEEAGEADARRDRRSRSACRSSTSARPCLTTRRGITDLGRYDPAAVRERFDLEPDAACRITAGSKAIRPTIFPAFPGVGEKTAIKLIKAAGSLDALIADPSLAGTPKLAERSSKSTANRRASAATSRSCAAICRSTIDWEAAATKRPAMRRSIRSTRSSSSRRCSRGSSRRSTVCRSSRATQSSRAPTAPTWPSVDPPEFARLADELRALADAPTRRARRARATRSASAARAASGTAFAASALAHENVRDGARARCSTDAPRIVGLRCQARRARACMRTA